MKFLIDEDVPVRILKTLSELGHEGIRVTPASSDREITRRAKTEERIIVTLDKDFTNSSLYPPSEFNIIQIAIHPPLKEVISNALKRFLTSTPETKLKGLIVLFPTGHIRFEE